jgi:PKD repeat protein
VCLDAVRLVRSTGGPSVTTAPGAGFSISESMGVAPLTVSFDGGVSADLDGDVLNYAWDFGDGTSSSLKSVSHEYTQPGEYKVSLTVSDGQRTSTAAGTIRVK